jgi:hypothetical protein
MLVLCGRCWGLVCSITRLVHFGRLPDNLCRKAEAVARVDATFITATRPGRTLGEVFRRGMAAYAETGFPDEWRLHHQGVLQRSAQLSLVPCDDDAHLHLQIPKEQRSKDQGRSLAPLLL